MDLRSAVEAQLREAGAPPFAEDLWMEIMDAFEEGGPTAVRKALEAMLDAARVGPQTDDPRGEVSGIEE